MNYKHYFFYLCFGISLIAPYQAYSMESLRRFGALFRLRSNNATTAMIEGTNESYQLFEEMPDELTVEIIQKVLAPNLSALASNLSSDISQEMKKVVKNYHTLRSVNRQMKRCIPTALKNAFQEAYDEKLKEIFNDLYNQNPEFSFYKMLVYLGMPTPILSIAESLRNAVIAKDAQKIKDCFSIIKYIDSRKELTEEEFKILIYDKSPVSIIDCALATKDITIAQTLFNESSNFNELFRQSLLSSLKIDQKKISTEMKLLINSNSY